MSEWLPAVVRIGEVFPHPNRGHADERLRCDTLSYTLVNGGYPALFRDGEYRPGDLAAYIPVDTKVPTSRPEFGFLSGSSEEDGTAHVRAKRIRGMFSMGLLVPAPAGLNEGDSVVSHFGLVKYDPPEEGLKMAGGQNIPSPEWLVHYTDIEGLRRYKHILALGEEVVITEKIHGQNGVYSWDPVKKKLWVASRSGAKKRDGDINWWNVANRLGLEKKLAGFPDYIVFGEVYGKSIQDLTYGLSNKGFLVFDIWDKRRRAYCDHDETVRLAKEMGLDMVPILYRGPWQGYETHAPLAEGKSTIADHVREGFVVRPVKERAEHCGRVIFKQIGEMYHLRDRKRKNERP